MEQERLTLTVAEAAELLGISKQSAYTAVKSGELPSVKVGKRVLVPKAKLLEMLGGSDGVER